jgi:serine O-acetyltransferase
VKLHIVGMIRARESGRLHLAKFLEGRLQRKFGIFISHKAEFPRSLDVKHATGVVIGEGVKLGERVTIYQHVTLGGARTGDWQAGNYPEIGDDTVIFAGAVVVGKVKIGRHCVIGANSVVTRDVPDFATAAGVPARIIRQRADEDLEQENTK